MNCGQSLPDGAKFCKNCGTPLNAVSPAGAAVSNDINLGGTHTFVPAMCPNCSAHMKVDSSSKIARCESCGTECLVQDAIKALTVRGNVQVGNATINVNGTNTESLLQRVEIMLADGDFNGAMSKCDTILDSDPKNGKVYFYMLMADLRCRNKNDLAYQLYPFDRNQYYSKALQFGDDNLKSELVDYTNVINEINNSIHNNYGVGKEISFGNINGQKMQWRVLKLQDRRALIITTNCIRFMKYHNFGSNITWHDCTLRKWLNSDFYNECFTREEKSKILSSHLSNDNNPANNTPGGAPTIDSIFLLSIYEADTLFSSFKDRANGSGWWLRSPGNLQNRAAYVADAGGICAVGRAVNSMLYEGVRPALWLDLNP